MKKQIGFIYILKNQAFPDLLKIGYTMRTVDERVKELSSATGVPYKFQVLYFIETISPAEKEKIIHERLSKYRVKGEGKDKEFFKIPLNEAKRVIDLVANPPIPTKPPIPPRITQEQRLQRKKAVEILLNIKYDHINKTVKTWMEGLEKNLQNEKKYIEESKKINKKRNRFGLISRMLYDEALEKDPSILEEYEDGIEKIKEFQKNYTFDAFLKEHQNAQGIDDVLKRRDLGMLTKYLGLRPLTYNTDFEPTENCPFKHFHTWPSHYYPEMYKIFSNWDDFEVPDTPEYSELFPGILPIRGGLITPIPALDNRCFSEIHFKDCPSPYLFSDWEYYKFWESKWLREWWQKIDPDNISPSNPFHQS